MTNNKDFSLQSAIIMRLIAKILKAKGITQQNIADATDFEQNNVSRMLAGKYPPTLANLLKILDAAKLEIILKDSEGKLNGEAMLEMLKEAAEGQIEIKPN